ncbi:MAG: aminoacyl-tRNA hydrolase [Candidatus Dojkabacteria bacterium]|nr:MAG: aminoacyl-tRNA hydrolase [Candidatus Dojkabacteria bacterium]
MLLIVGLGNPGSKYENTPHNAGYLFLDQLREFLGWDTLYSVGDWEEDKMFESQICKARVGGETKVMLVKPLTFMNASGRAVSKIVKKFEVRVSSGLVVVHDDLDIKLGQYKLQRAKSPKAHNGITSVELSLGTNDFLRLRIGVENRSENNRIPGEDYVLNKMSQEELDTLKEIGTDATKSLRTLVEF